MLSHPEESNLWKLFFYFTEVDELNAALAAQLATWSAC